MHKRIIPVIIVVLILSYTGFKLYSSSQAAKETLLSGFIEGTEVVVKSQASGQILAIDLREGDSVKSGQVIASVDTEKINHELSSMRFQMESANTNIAKAEESLSIMESTAERGIQKADASRRIASEQLNDMKNGYPSEDVESAKIALKLAEDNLEYAKDDYEKFKNLLSEGVVARKEFDLVEQKMKAAEREYEIRNETYMKLKRGYDSEKVSQAERNLDIAEITYRDALSGRDEIDIKRREIDSLRTMRDSFQSQISLLESRIDDFSIKAPVDGLINVRHVEVGELVSTGSPIVSIIKPDDKWIRVYIPATDLELVNLGDEFEIRLDSYPDRTFTGKVTFVSQDAEFTPKNVQIKKERVKQVYEVRLDIVEEPELVKTGMAGDVVLREK